MKVYEMKVSLLKKRRKISRTLQVPASTTFAQLHQMIQIAFNCENVEYYEFETSKHLYKRLKDEKHTLASSKKISFEEDEKFEYRYDLINPLYFQCHVIQILSMNLKYPCVIDHEGKNLYEGVDQKIDSKRQSDFDSQWVNERLKGFSKDSAIQKQFNEEMRQAIKQLVSIRHFQDYMHGQVVRVECPQKRFVYFGCDAKKDLVLNFHRNASNLVQYLQMNKQALDVSLERYQNCITLSLYKIDASEKSNYDYTALNYGGFIASYDVFESENIREDEKVLYVYALKKYVHVIQTCAQNNWKLEEGMMRTISLKDEISIEPLVFEDEKVILGFESAVADYFSSCVRSDDTIEIDVMTLEAGHEQELCSTLLLIARDNCVDEITLQNASLKTIMSEVFLDLEAQFFQKGIANTILVRDKNMAQMISSLAQELKIEVQISTHLPMIDHHYYEHYYSKILDEHEIPIDQVVNEIFHSMGIDNVLLDEIVLPKDMSFEEGLEEVLRQLVAKRINYKKLN